MSKMRGITTLNICLPKPKPHIVSYGVFVGAGKTLAPCGINLVSMWIVRLGLSAIMVKTMGLYGVWLAMAIELCFRGVIYLLYISSKRWLNTRVTSP